MNGCMVVFKLMTFLVFLPFLLNYINSFSSLKAEPLQKTMIEDSILSLELKINDYKNRGVEYAGIEWLKDSITNISIFFRKPYSQKDSSIIHTAFEKDYIKYLSFYDKLCRLNFIDSCYDRLCDLSSEAIIFHVINANHSSISNAKVNFIRKRDSKCFLTMETNSSGEFSLSMTSKFKCWFDSRGDTVSITVTSGKQNGNIDVCFQRQGCCTFYTGIPSSTIVLDTIGSPSKSQ